VATVVKTRPDNPGFFMTEVIQDRGDFVIRGSAGYIVIDPVTPGFQGEAGSKSGTDFVRRLRWTARFRER